MFALILLAVLSVTSTVTGDDSTSDDPTSTIAVITSPSIPSYSCISPKSTPVYGLDDTVSFVWNATGFSGGGYFCHSYRQGLDEFDTSSWFQSYWETHTSGVTVYEAYALGRSLSLANFTGWPATCQFGMAVPKSTDIQVNVGGGNFFMMPATTSAIGPTTSPYMTTTVGPTTPPTSTPVADQGLPAGAKPGIAIGVILGVALVAGAVYWIRTMQQKLKAQHACLTRMEEVNDLGQAPYPIMNPMHGMNPSSPGVGSMMQYGSHRPEAAVEMSPVSIKQKLGYGVHEMPGK